MITMLARVQDVQSADCHGQLGYSFSVWDENGKLALTVGFATSEEADQAFEQVKAIVARALLVICPR
jgi:hypothetical protein